VETHNTIAKKLNAAYLELTLHWEVVTEVRMAVWLPRDLVLPAANAAQEYTLSTSSAPEFSR
jgi:hypothetical protein